jgi:hypothetical protein
MAKHEKKEVFSGIDEDLHDMTKFQKIIKTGRGRKRVLNNQDKENEKPTKKLKPKPLSKKGLAESKLSKCLSNISLITVILVEFKASKRLKNYLVGHMKWIDVLSKFGNKTNLQ